MSQSESFDAFYARTSWNVTNQVHGLAGADPLADHAIREAYAKAYQQWYEVSAYPDPEAWVVGVANDAYQRRRGEATGAGDRGPATGQEPMSWPGMWRDPRPPSEPAADPDATLDPRPAAQAPAASAGAATADAGPLASAAAVSPAAPQVPPGSLFGSPSPASPPAGQRAAAGAVAGGASQGSAASNGETSDWFSPAGQGAAFGGDGPPRWPDQPSATPTAAIGQSVDLATTAGYRVPQSPSRYAGTAPALRSRRTFIVVAAVVAVLLAGGLYYALGGLKSPHGTTPPASSGAPGKPAVHMLAAGQTGERAAIPWTLIGPGWTLVNVSTAQPTSSGTPTGGAHTTYLVDPVGGKYRIRTTYGAAGPYLLAWSGDAKEALYAVSRGPASPAATYGLLTLTSGNMTALSLPAGVKALGFTRPDGLNIVAIQQTASKYRLQRYNLDGSRQATIGTMPRSAGAPSFARSNALSSPDGTTAVWGVDGDGMQLVSNNAGGFTHKLRMPGVGSPKSCTPISWWDANSVLAYCSAAGQPDTGRLWRAPVGGGQPKPLTGISGNLSGQGFLTGAWQTDGAVYITSTTANQCSGAPSGPGGQQILQLSSSGAETSVQIPASTNNHDSVVAAVGGRLLVLAQTSCPGTSSLIWFTPSTHATQSVLIAPSGQAGVLSAVPYGAGPAAYSDS